jgi:hypothetical protein
MPFKVSSTITRVTQQSVDTPDVAELQAQEAPEASQDTAMSVASIASGAGTSVASQTAAFTNSQQQKIASQNVGKTTVKARDEGTRSVPLSSDVVSQINKGEAPSVSSLKTAAQSAAKSLKSDTSSTRSTRSSVVSQISKRGNAALKSELSITASSARGGSSTRARSGTSSRARTSAHSTAWAATPSAVSSLSVVGTPERDQATSYGLYLLKPEIVTLYDSDPLLDENDNSTDAHEFLTMQFSTAKTVQESAYRRTRKLLSRLSYLPSIGFNESDLQPVDPINARERQGTSLFEQTVSKWDADYASLLDAEALATEKSVAAQNLAAAFDIANLPDTSYDYLSFKSIADQAVQEINSSPTSAKKSISTEIFSGITVAAEFDLHNYNRNTDGETFIASLLGFAGTISASYRSYTLMHALMQQSYVAFAFGSARQAGSTYVLDRQKEAFDPQSTYKYAVNDDPLGKLAVKSTFASTDSFAQDSYNLTSSTTSEIIAKVLLLRLTGVAAYNNSQLLSQTRTALDTFQSRVGLPVGITSGAQGTGNPISDFESSLEGSSAYYLFQESDESFKQMFFDRSHNPGLPVGYVHGYASIFGDASDPAGTATSLLSRINSAVSQNESIDKKLLSSKVTVKGKTYSAADLSRVVLEQFASLLESQWASQTFARNYGEYETSGFKLVYANYLDVAGNQTAINKTVSLEAFNPTLIAQEIFALGDVETEDSQKLPVFVDHEVLRLLTLSVPSTGEVQDWTKYAVDLMMQYWSQRFDVEVGTSSTQPSSINSKIYAENPITAAAVKSALGRLFADTSYILRLDTYLEDSLDRIVKWSINTAQTIFPTTTTLGYERSTKGQSSSTRSSLTSLPVYASVVPHDDGTLSYTFKDICLLLTLFAAHHTNALFDRVEQVESDAYSPYTRFKDDAGRILDDLVSFVPISFDDARLCLAVINAQLRTVSQGLQRVVEGDLLVNGRFSYLYTPAQIASAAIRRYEFLFRRQSAPFHCPRYDEASSARALERSAIQCLYRSDLMKRDDTRVLFVGMPIGIQHVIGLRQRFAKVTVTRRDQEDTSKQYNKLTFVFDMFTFISPDTSVALGKTPWTSSDTGTLSSITNVSYFDLPTSPESSKEVGTLQGGVASTVETSYAQLTGAVDTVTSSSDSITREKSGSSLTTAADRIESEIESGGGGIAITQVLLSDFIVDVEFIDASSAAEELNVDEAAVAGSPILVGNHLADYLLKTHIRNVAGLDLAESTYTTSERAFDLSTSTTLDTARAYVFDLCTVDFMSGKTVGTSDFDATVRHLDVLSRTPLVRSTSYASLCTSPTYLDRVFAVPISISQFTPASE